MKVSDGIELKLLSLEHRDELFRLVDTNREHLREWLPWLDTNRSTNDTEAFIESVTAQHNSGKGPQYAVFHDTNMCGVCGFHPMDMSNRIGAIGYWLCKRYSGHGIMTKAVQMLVEVGFREYHLNRIEIACATANRRSRAIPERLGFQFEAVLREREYLYGQYVDHAIYSLLASDSPLKQRLHGDPALPCA